MTEKTCSNCNTIKDREDFSVGRAVCKECRAAEARSMRHTSRGRIATHICNNKYNISLHGRSMRLLKDAQRRAAIKNLPIDIDHAWIYDRLKNGICEVTGLEFVITSGIGRTAYSPSLDRIDCTKGYTKGNVRMVLWIVNAIASDWGLEIVADIVDKWRQHRGEPGSGHDAADELLKRKMT